MTDVFKVRFDGREWWATGDDERVGLWHQKDLEPLGSPVLIVPERMVERIEELPPEPPAGTVLWDEHDVAWVRLHSGWWSRLGGDRWQSVSKRGPLHPYPRAARDEIKQLTAERADWKNTARSTRTELLAALNSLDGEKSRADDLQKRIDAAAEWCNQFPGLARILRGES